LRSASYVAALGFEEMEAESTKPSMIEEYPQFETIEENVDQSLFQAEAGCTNTPYG
jgi:hypothetical protein